MKNDSPTRVTKAHPCPICEKPDWCLLGDDVAICMRIFSGRSKTFADGSVGYLHHLEGKSQTMVWRKSKKEKPAQILNSAAKLDQWKIMWGSSTIPRLAGQLGVSFESLFYLGCQLTSYYQTWAFPMRNSRNDIVGIRLRSEAGHKWAEKGSHQGLFIPQFAPHKTVYLVEGPTDTAAALTLGVYSIGRPSCNGGATELLPLLKRLGIRQAVIVADADTDRTEAGGRIYNPGIDGAISLSEQLAIPNCTLALPAKDMRQFLTSGGNKKLLESLTSQCVWRNP